jgi:hypothetical protein
MMAGCHGVGAPYARRYEYGGDVTVTGPSQRGMVICNPGIIKMSIRKPFLQNEGVGYRFNIIFNFL